MKTTTRNLLLYSLTIASVIGVMSLSSCTDPEFAHCKMTGFIWEGKDFTLVYTGDRLDQFVAADTHIDLTYNELDQLVTAEFYLPGDGGTPSTTETYYHGPFGITQIDELSSSGIFYRSY